MECYKICLLSDHLSEYKQVKNEHQLNEDDIDPDTYQEIIDRHINDLLRDTNKCELNDALDDRVEEIDPELP